MKISPTLGHGWCSDVQLLMQTVSCANVCMYRTVKEGEELHYTWATPLLLTLLQPRHLVVSAFVKGEQVIDVPPPPLLPLSISLSLSLTLCFFPCWTRIMSPLGKLNWPIRSPTVRNPSYSLLDLSWGTADALIWEREKETKKNCFTQTKPDLEISYWGH